jgi:hypothetical protein
MFIKCEQGGKVNMKEVWYYDLLAMEKGMIKAWQHTKIMCNACIKAHKEEIVRLKRMKRERKEKP